MKIKALILSILCVMLLLVGCGQKEPEYLRECQHEKYFFDNGMQQFPSYDWGAEDANALASIAANTHGTDKHKQEAILYALDRVWYHDHISLQEWTWRRYELYNSPTEHDYELVTMIIFGEWAED